MVLSINVTYLLSFLSFVLSFLKILIIISSRMDFVASPTPSFRIKVNLLWKIEFRRMNKMCDNVDKIAALNLIWKSLQRLFREKGLKTIIFLSKQRLQIANRHGKRLRQLYPWLCAAQTFDTTFVFELSFKCLGNLSNYPCLFIVYSKQNWINLNFASNYKFLLLAWALIEPAKCQPARNMTEVLKVLIESRWLSPFKLFLASTIAELFTSDEGKTASFDTSSIADTRNSLQEYRLPDCRVPERDRVAENPLDADWWVSTVERVCCLRQRRPRDHLSRVLQLFSGEVWEKAALCKETRSTGC